ncbi:MAG: GTPase Era [Candidatus Omnitrophica bacterium]|nr:GTPase Era [Candidatus Omnitrophota bacterium]MCB9747205.1 GTPase Era [Candidatus Omnitrophota bacterium]
MTDKKGFKCGMVSIVGRPNVGKSTLLNSIVGEKIAIVSTVPQTTRQQIRGIYNDKRGQIVFIDTPGLHMAKDKLDQFMNKASAATVDEVDCLIYLVDTSRKIGREEESIAQNLKTVKKPIIFGLNKVDLKGKYLSEYIEFWEKVKEEKVEQMKNFSMIALSGEKERNVEKLVDILFDFLPEGPALYPEDIISDFPQKLAIADIIREKLLKILRQEIPHSVGVVIEHMQPVKKKTMHIKGLILVEKETQKEIVIGKQGRVLKQVGTEARKELEDLLETKVFLELHVKYQKRWRDNISLLQELGYGQS